ncbi:response regulator [Flavivirga algicola]|uniref:Response regulator transcription factor n=1 Tax=Flavivirga algicola TaxID=2729136 RepID=A0ABX1S3I7_9FLAO|nr:response regulator [Flavivirga algicola]NMH88999.1 response regulator transcription factor [Flavivirga algicola]
MNILIVEDHPLISDAYENALKQVSSNHTGLEFNIDKVTNCDDAYFKIKNTSKPQTIDMVFLDIKLPPSQDGKIISGEDLGVKIRLLLPNTKIVIVTTYNDNYRMNSIFKSVDPDGFLIKNDLSPNELILAIESVIQGDPYYSKSVIKLMRKQSSNNLMVDAIDRKLLYELSRGTKMNELPEIIPLSKAAIERRKRLLKEIFNVNNKSDRALLEVAEQKGFI